MTHTPLPWAMVYGADGHHCIFAYDGPIAVVSVQADADRQDANANLLLGAPELLAFARGVVQEWDEYTGDSSWTGNMPAYIEAARAAIAKAEGR